MPSVEKQGAMSNLPADHPSLQALRLQVTCANSGVR